MKKRDLATGWTGLLIQMIMIAFGVYLGMLANDWSTKRKEQREVKNGLQSIANEIAFNKNFLEGRVEYYKQVVTVLDSLIEVRSAEAPIEDIPGFRGINPILLRHSSFQLAQSTQVLSNMDYQLADKIALVYTLQDFQLMGVDKFLDGYVMGQVKNLGDFRMMFQNFVMMGEELLRFYTQVQPELPEPNTDVQIR